MIEHVPVITIDGPGGSGKGTIAYMVAQHLQWHLLDSGALYRVLALAAQNHGVGLEDEASLRVLAEHLDVQFQPMADSPACDVVLEGESVSRALRTESCGESASIVAAFPVVRSALLLRQSAFREAPGLVADGRDMGTVVFTDADLKVFLTASAEERAERRYKQLKGKGFDVSLRALFEDIRTRDERDAQRAVSPLVPAEDAIILDSTGMSIEAVFDQVVQEARKRALLQ